MSDKHPNPTVFRVSDLSAHKPVLFDVVPDKTENMHIASQLGLSGLRKLTFRGKLIPEGKSDWRLEAQLGATVTQPCIVTLNPVTTRIDQHITRRFLANMPDIDGDEEIEIPDDDTTEPLQDEIDLILVMSEALALALPDYPRCADAELGNAEFAAPGVTPITDEEIKPFASLAGLRDKLEKGE